MPYNHKVCPGVPFRLVSSILGRRGRDSDRDVRVDRDDILAARHEHVHVRCTAPLLLYRNVNHVLSRDIDLGHFGADFSGLGARDWSHGRARCTDVAMHGARKKNKARLRRVRGAYPRR